jgi:multiple PDZ domain protein
VVARPAPKSPGKFGSTSSLPVCQSLSIETVELINDGAGLGFGIVGGSTSGVMIKTILENGVADKGDLHSGDLLLKINDTHLRGMGSDQVADVLRHVGNKVVLVVGRLTETNGFPSHIYNDPRSLDEYLARHAEEDQEELPEVETFQVNLTKDSQGLGITIAGYVCEKEDLSGIFVKSITPCSAASANGRICINDQIIEVDGQSLTGYSNHKAVELLRSTGAEVTLTIARYLRGPKYEQLQLAIANALPAPQLANYDLPEHNAEFATDVGLMQKWTTIHAKQYPHSNFSIIVATVEAEDLGITLDRHYIKSISQGSALQCQGTLMPGDELLEINGKKLTNLTHGEILKILNDLPNKVKIVCARTRTVPLVKAKSDGSLASPTTPEVPSKSRSLEPLSSGLALWDNEIQIIELIKGDRGLGFSILDYQDPLKPDSTLIVIRSLVPSGVAQIDGRLIPGDRLVSVNNIDLSNATLEEAVQALKGLQRGVVQIGICKPLHFND